MNGDNKLFCRISAVIKKTNKSLYGLELFGQLLVFRAGIQGYKMANKNGKGMEEMI